MRSAVKTWRRWRTCGLDRFRFTQHGQRDLHADDDKGKRCCYLCPSPQAAGWIPTPRIKPPFRLHANHHSPMSSEWRCAMPCKACEKMVIMSGMGPGIAFSATWSARVAVHSSRAMYRNCLSASWNREVNDWCSMSTSSAVHSSRAM